MKNPALPGPSRWVQPAGVVIGVAAFTKAISSSPDAGACANAALSVELVPYDVTPVSCTTDGAPGALPVGVGVGTGVAVGWAVLVGAGDGVALGTADGDGDGDGALFTMTVGLQPTFSDWYQR